MFVLIYVILLCLYMYVLLVYLNLGACINYLKCVEDNSSMRPPCWVFKYSIYYL